MKISELYEDLSFFFFLFLMFFGAFIVFRYSDVDYDTLERECVVFYKENHYITNNCEKYRENLENMEV